MSTSARDTCSSNSLPADEYPSLGGPRWEAIAERRMTTPVYQLHEFPNVYVVTRYDDVRFVLSRDDIFSSDRVRAELAGYSMVDASSQDSVTMAESDPPDHTGKRNIAFAAVKPGRLRGLIEPLTQRISDELIDDFITEGRCEFVREFAAPLPVRLILCLMDLGPEHEQLFGLWAQNEASGLLWCDDEFRRGQAERTAKLTVFLTSLVQERYETLGDRDDLVSHVIRAQLARDSVFNLEYVRSQVATLASGGIRTTAYFFPSLMRMLATDPDLVNRLKANHDAIQGVIEEALRVEPPLVWSPRRVRKTVRLSGYEIPEGSFVVALLGSANRDEQTFAAADSFEPARRNARDHVSFGYGRHSCIGAPLARLELRAALERLLTRLEQLHLADEGMHRAPSASFNGLTELRLKFTPGKRQLPS